MHRTRLPRHSSTIAVSRRTILLSGISSVLLSACGGGTDSPHRRFPAETEFQDKVMLSAPTVDYKQGWSMLAAQAQIINALLPAQKVIYLVNTLASDNPESNDVEMLVAALAKLNVSPETVRDGVTFLKVPHADLWVRDTGGLFIHDENGGVSVVDFDFDGYRFMPYSDPEVKALYEFDNDVSVRVAGALGLPVIRSNLVAEGGNLVIRNGTALAVKSSFVQSNPGWTLAQIEAELERALGIRKVIWLPRSLATDAHPVLQTPYQMGRENAPYLAYNLGVNHADELVAWVNDTTVMLPEVSEAEVHAANLAGDPTAAINRAVLEDCASVLSHATNAEGSPITLVRVPEPGAIEVELTPDDVMYATLLGMNAHPEHKLRGIERLKDGQPIRFLLAAGYLNFVVANEVVLVPKFYKAGRAEQLAMKDEKFRAIVQNQYPTRKVVQIDVDAITVGGGGMHCITQQVPSRP